MYRLVVQAMCWTVVFAHKELQNCILNNARFNTDNVPQKVNHVLSLIAVNFAFLH